MTEISSRFDVHIKLDTWTGLETTSKTSRAAQ